MDPTRRTVLIGATLPVHAAMGRRANRDEPLTALDGAPLTGRFYGSGVRAVLLAPGGHGVGETWHPQAERLAHVGFRVLTPDYRGRGPGARIPPDDTQSHLDVLGAVERLRRDGAAEVFAVGASWGGWAVGTAAVAQPDWMSRLVFLAHSPFENADRLRGRKLFITGREDRDGQGRVRLDAIRAQFELAPEPKALITLESAAHAQFLFLTPLAGQLQRHLERFLSEP